jgi:hypothetical protein
MRKNQPHLLSDRHEVNNNNPILINLINIGIIKL